MSPFGKILAFLNVLGVLGFISLGMMDYARRQAWSYLVYRHELVITGLPLDKAETDKEGHLLWERMSQQTAKELFPTNPVFTQVEEVQRVKKALDGKLRATSEAKKQLHDAAVVLLPFAITNAQREDLISLRAYLKDDSTYDTLKKQMGKAQERALELLKIEAENPARADRKKRTPQEAFSEMLYLGGGDIKRPFEQAFLKAAKGDLKRPLDELMAETLESLRAEKMAEVDRLFTEALADENVDDFKRWQANPGLRRERIARLLMLTVELTPEDAKAPASGNLWEAPGYKRVLNVIGLKAAMPAINRQAQILGQFAEQLRVESGTERTISSDLAEEMERERTRFITLHQTYLDYLQSRATQVAEQEKLLARKKDQAGKQKDLVDARKKDVADYEEKLAAAQKVTAAELDKVRKMSKGLFEVRRDTRNANQVNLEYEGQIRRMERERLP
jgi:hypothetical protein